MKRRFARNAFTLVELLVVIGIIAILVSVLLPALSRARLHAQRVNCASNLRQIGQVWHMYSNENQGYFPASGVRLSNWALITVDQRDLFINRYRLRNGRIFYCPNYRPFTGQLSDNDWEYTRTDTTPHTVPISYAIYSNNLDAKFWYQALRNNLAPPVKNRDKRLAERPLAMDETDFYSPPYYGFKTYAFSNHYERGPFPSGGNGLFGDGHVEWRHWKQMVTVLDTGTFKRWF